MNRIALILSLSLLTLTAPACDPDAIAAADTLRAENAGLRLRVATLRLGGIEPTPQCEPDEGECRAAETCAEAGVDKFCDAVGDLAKAWATDLRAELVDACVAMQPHCDLCEHLRTACEVQGYDPDKCAEQRDTCNCLALAAGVP